MTRKAAAKAVVSPAVQTAFDALMKAYPARGDNPRAPALVVFARLIAEGDDAEMMVKAAGRFAAVLKAEAREARMIPHTRTWLSQRRFEDYLTDDQASAPTGPKPDHPLFWLAAEIGDAAWMSWIAPLTVEKGKWGYDPCMVVRAPTLFALKRVQQDYGDMIRAQLGVETQFRLAKP